MNGNERPHHSSDAAIREQLTRICKSRGFQKAERLKRFLGYVVEQTLAGAEQDLKEYTIALEVFDRRPDYNPRIDAAVRVEAGRLRSRLKDYYDAEGHADPILIELPKGNYAPIFTFRSDAAPLNGKAVPRWRGRKAHALYAIGAVLSIVALVNVLPLRPAVTRPPPNVRQLVATGIEGSITTSRDGRFLALTSDGGGNPDIWLRPLASGDPLQLTHHPSTDWEPEFTPNTNSVYFRSERDGGGIYRIASTGGAETLIAERGRAPKISPDGRSLAYWTGRFWTQGAKVHVVTLQTGVTKQLASDLVDARFPLWTPDGTHLVVWGRRLHEMPDLYAVPVRDGASEATGWMRALGKSSLLPVFPFRHAYDGQRYVFSAFPVGQSRSPLGFRDSPASTWQVSLPANLRRVRGSPEQLTSGSGFEVESTLLPSGDFLFTGVNLNTFTYAVDIDNPAAPRKISDTRGGGYPRIGSDRETLLMLAERDGQVDVWAQNLSTREHRRITSSTEAEYNPVLTVDRRTVFYATRKDRRRWMIHRIPASGGSSERVCEDCGPLYDISADNRFALFGRGDAAEPWILDLQTRAQKPLLAATHRATGGRWSPDGRWVVMGENVESDREQLVVAPFHPDRPAREDELIGLTRALNTDSGPVWAPDGATVYFLSESDGHRCIWRVRFDAQQKRAASEPEPFIHFHEWRMTLPLILDPAMTSLSVARNWLVFSGLELSADVYAATWPSAK